MMQVQMLIRLIHTRPQVTPTRDNIDAMLKRVGWPAPLVLSQKTLV